MHDEVKTFSLLIISFQSFSWMATVAREPYEKGSFSAFAVTVRKSTTPSGARCYALQPTDVSHQHPQILVQDSWPGHATKCIRWARCCSAPNICGIQAWSWSKFSAIYQYKWSCWGSQAKGEFTFHKFVTRASNPDESLWNGCFCRGGKSDSRIRANLAAQYVPKMYGIWKTDCTFLCLKDNLQTLDAIPPISELHVCPRWKIWYANSLLRIGFKSRDL